MSCNKDRPHILVLPEDDANRQLADGFHNHVGCWPRQMQVLPVAGGWNAVLERFNSDHVKDMGRFPKRFMVLLIDFDAKEERLKEAQAAIPPHLADRVFVLGAWSNPEALRADLGIPYERIGAAMADDCREETDTTWGHNLLQHNASELGRLRQQFARSCSSPAPLRRRASLPGAPVEVSNGTRRHAPGLRLVSTPVKR